MRSVKSFFILFAFIFLSLGTKPTFADGLNIGSSNTFKENLIEAIYTSNILDIFWNGDDGIECGEPQIKLLVIDYSKHKIIFEVDPAARHYTCEARLMTCEVSFSEDENQLIIVENSSVSPYDESCSL